MPRKKTLWAPMLVALVLSLAVLACVVEKAPMKIGTVASSLSTAKGEIAEPTDARGPELTPPEDGVYLVEEGKLIRLPMQDLDPLSGAMPVHLVDMGGVSWPRTSSSRPIVLAQSPDLSVGSLRLIYLRAGLGFGTEGTVVTRVFEGSGAAQGGLQYGDTIIAISDQDVDESSKIADMTQGPLGDSVQVAVLRGTATRELTLTRNMVFESRELPHSYATKGEFVQLTPDDDLRAGDYCYAMSPPYTPTGKGWCFQVTK